MEMLYQPDFSSHRVFVALDASSNKRFSNLHQTHKNNLSKKHTQKPHKPFLITNTQTPTPLIPDPFHGNIISYCNWVFFFLPWKLGNFHYRWRLRHHGVKNHTQPGSSWKALKIWPDDGKRQWRKRSFCPFSCRHS